MAVVRTPQVAATIVLEQLWTMASAEDEDDDLVGKEFNDLVIAAMEEEFIGRALNCYRISHTDLFFVSFFNDPAMYTFVGLLYTSRLFQHEENRAAAAAGNVQESELLKLAQLSFDSCCRKQSEEIEDILHRVLKSDFFTHEPQRLLTLNLVRERLKAPEVATHVSLSNHFQEAEKLLAGINRIDTRGPVRHLSPHERFREDEQAFELSEEQRIQLVAAAARNGFFRDLISLKPPESRHISHEQALLECAEHARLWLFQAELPLYYNFGLLYSELARGDTVTAIEQEAWHSDTGYNACLPSAEEKQQRRITLACFWDQIERGGGVIHILMPELLEEAECTTEEARIFKYLACPTLLMPEGGTLHDNLKMLVGYAEGALQRIRMVDIPKKVRALQEFALEKQKAVEHTKSAPEVDVAPDPVRRDAAPKIVLKSGKRGRRGPKFEVVALRKSPRLHPPLVPAL